MAGSGNKPGYRVLNIDLTVARQVSLIDTSVGVGIGYDSVTILAVPAGATVNLHFGSNSDPYPVGNLQGETIETTTQDENGCIIPTDDGLYIDNPAGAGTLTVGVSYARPGVPLPNT